MRLFYLSILFIGFTLPEAVAQIDSSAVNNSPYTAIYNHLYYLQHESYDPQRAALSLPDNIPDKITLSNQLKAVLDGKGYYIDLNRVPKDPDFVDSVNLESIYFLRDDEARIYVEKIDDSWHYSRTTMDRTPELLKEVYPFGSDIIQQFKGPFWSYGILGFTSFQWIGLLVILIIALLFYRLIRGIIVGLLSAILKRRFGLPEAVQKDIVISGRLISMLLTIRIILILLPILHLPIRPNAMVIKGLNIISITLLVYLIVQVASIILHYVQELTLKTSSSMDDQLMPIVSRIIHIAIWAFGFIYILDYMDINVTALLAGISIGGLALALAAQDTVKNFLGSIMIFLDRPFQIGDVISFGNTEGVVEEVGVRSTRIRSFTNSLFYVPNGILADKVINNVGLRKFRRFKMTLGVTYDTETSQLELFVAGLRKILDEHPDLLSDKSEVHVNNLSASSIDILIYSFIDTDAWKIELGTRHELILSFLNLAKELDISYAYPSQTVYLEQA